MNIILSIVGKILLLKTIGKIFFSTTYIIHLLVVVKTSITKQDSFLDALKESIPASVMTILAIIFGIIILLERAIKAWKKYRSVKKAEEDLERDELDTAQKKKELEE